MRMALKLAKKGESKVSPNPLVGCVIEKNNHVIGIGWHKGGGCNHAEVEALSHLKAERNKNCILWSWLEERRPIHAMYSILTKV